MPTAPREGIIAGNDSSFMPAYFLADFGVDAVVQLTVRNISEQVVRALKRRAADHGRSAEAEHRDILRKALLAEEESFASRAKALRTRLRSTVDSTDLIRADRDRDTTARDTARRDTAPRDHAP